MPKNNLAYLCVVIAGIRRTGQAFGGAALRVGVRPRSQLGLGVGLRVVGVGLAGESGTFHLPCLRRATLLRLVSFLRSDGGRVLTFQMGGRILPFEGRLCGWRKGLLFLTF